MKPDSGERTIKATVRKPWMKNYTLTSTAYGVVFGFLFPLAATIIHCVLHKISVSPANIVAAHANNPLLIIIDTAPLFLGLFAALAGKRQDTIYRLSRMLEKKLDTRTRELAETSESLDNEVKERVRTEEDLHNTRGELLESEKMSALGQLLAGVAEELQEPIDFLKDNHLAATEKIGTVKRLLSALLADDGKRVDLERNIGENINHLDELLRHHGLGTRRLTVIVRSLTDFSRLDEVDSQPVNVNHLLDETLVIMHNQVKNIKVSGKYGDLPAVRGRPAQLGHVFLNILKRAVNAAILDRAAEEALIEIVTREEEGLAVIEISDNGPELDEKIIDTIFDPFAATNTAGKETDLGLAIAREMVRNHHGDITCSSSNCGTTFTVSIPVDSTS